MAPATAAQRRVVGLSSDGGTKTPRLYICQRPATE